MITKPRYFGCMVRKHDYTVGPTMSFNKSGVVARVKRDVKQVWALARYARTAIAFTNKLAWVYI